MSLFGAKLHNPRMKLLPHKYTGTAIYFLEQIKGNAAAKYQQAY